MQQCGGKGENTGRAMGSLDGWGREDVRVSVEGSGLRGSGKHVPQQRGRKDNLKRTKRGNSQNQGNCKKASPFCKFNGKKRVIGGVPCYSQSNRKGGYTRKRKNEHTKKQRANLRGGGGDQRPAI